MHQTGTKEMMMMKNDMMIGHREALTLLVTLMSGQVFLSMPRNMALLGDTAGWLIVLLSGIFSLIGYYFLASLLKEYPGLDILQISQSLCGKYLGTLFSIIFFLFFLSISSLMLRQFAESFIISILPNTPISIVCFFFLFLLVYGAIQGIETLTRVAWFFGPYLLLAFIVTIGFSMPYADLQLLLPILGKGPLTLLKHSVFHISLFSNVPAWGVISMWDVDTIYKVPRMLHQQGLDGLICDKLRLNTPPANLKRWDDLVYETEHPKSEVHIAMVGKYVDLSDSYKSLNEALRHAGMKNHAKVKIEYIDSETINATTVKQLARFDAILVPGGFGKRGIEGKIATARFARENKLPYLGICLGMQVATIEYARDVAGLVDANSTEFEPSTPHPVIALITEWKDADGTIKNRDENSDLGGTMRLGAQTSDVEPGTLAHDIYGDVVTERHRHRYEANVHYLDTLRKAGLIISAKTQREHLTEIVELPRDVHPWYVGVQFHPEFKSTPWNGHPLFNAFIKASLDHQAAGQGLDRNLKAVKAVA